MMNSAEGAVLHAVLEGHTERAAERLHENFNDHELVGFGTSLATLLSLVHSEIDARGGRDQRVTDWLSVADTGEMNIVRGRE